MQIIRSAACVGVLASIVGIAVLAGGCTAGPAESLGADSVGEAQPVLDPPVAEAAHASPVRVGWEEDLERPLFARQGAMHAWLLNERAQPMTARLYAMSRGVDRPAAMSLGTVYLAAGERRVIDVPLDKFPVQSTHAPIAVTLFVDVEEQGARTRFPSESLYVAFSPDYVTAMASAADPIGPLVAAASGFDVHDARVAELLAGRNVVPTDARALVERFANPAGRALGPDGKMHDFVASDTTVSGIASAALAPHLDQDEVEIPPALMAPLPNQATICANYDVSYTDAHFGEDHLAAGGWYLLPPDLDPVWIPFDIPARHAKITFSRNGSVVATRQLDANGCTKLSLITGTYTVQISTRVSNGSTTYDVYKIWPQPIDSTCEAGGGTSSAGVGGPSKCKGYDSFTGTFNMPTAAYSKTFTSDGATPAFRVAAVAGHALSMPNNGLEPEVYTAYANSGCGSFDWKEACASGGNVYFGKSVGVGNKDTTLEKFIIGHEMGHAFEQHAYGNFGVSYADDPTAPVSCRCDHVVSANALHCLQSRHSFSTAHTEGFAHFVAENMFNRIDQTDCKFVYYKEVRLDSGAIKSPPYAVDCAAPPKWLESHCVKANSGTEWDILSFLRAATAGGPNALTMTEVFGVYAKARQAVSTLTWPALQTAALQYFGNDAANLKYQHLLASAQAAGIQH